MKIFAVGMNYAQHNKELDGTLYKPETPVIFTKADSALLKDRKPFFIPDHLGQIDYEVSLLCASASWARPCLSASHTDIMML